MTPFELAEARARLELPLRWTVAVRLPTLSRVLDLGPLHWPVVGPRVVEGKLVPFRHVDELAGIRPDVVMTELVDAADGDVLAAGARTGWSVLVFTGDAPRSYLGHALEFASPRCVVLPSHDHHGHLAYEAARYTEAIVRERATLQLLAHWREALQAYQAAGEAALAGSQDAPALPTRARLAPLATVEHVHVAGVLGLWFDARAKGPPEALRISPGRLGRVLERGPEGVREAVKPLPGLQAARLMLVEDSLPLARSTARALEATAKMIGRQLDVRLVTTGEEARALIEKDGPPELIWADVRLAGKMTGLELVQWLRRERFATVVYGKTGEADPETVRRFGALGAISVWTGLGLPALPAGLHAGLSAAEEAEVIRRGEVKAELLSEKLAGALQRGLVSADVRQRSAYVRDRMAALGADLGALPAETGRAELSLEELRHAAARDALGETPSLGEASVALGIDSKTLRTLLREA